MQHKSGLTQELSKTWRVSCFYVFALHIVQKLLLIWVDSVRQSGRNSLPERFLDKYYGHCGLVTTLFLSDS